MTADSLTGPLGYRYGEEEGFWEVNVYPTPVELVGGAGGAVFRLLLTLGMVAGAVRRAERPRHAAPAGAARLVGGDRHIVV